MVVATSAAVTELSTIPGTNVVQHGLPDDRDHRRHAHALKQPPQGC
jgi:hypothetical protein